MRHLGGHLHPCHTHAEPTARRNAIHLQGTPAGSSGQTCTFSHQAFLYGSPDELVAGMAPLVRDGLARGDAVFAATRRDNVDALREELGDDADAVRLEDTAEWVPRPYDRLQALERAVADLEPGQGLTAVGEPVWEGTPAVIRQWARFESVLNLALADAPMRSVCLYDSSALPDRILDYAVATHPERVAHDGRRLACDDFVDPHRFDPGPLAAPPRDATELPLQSGEMRAVLAEFARREGIGGERLDDLVLAASEVMANAVRHGDAPTQAVAWSTEDEVVCQIADRGPGVADPLAGWLPPSKLAIGGWGLPIARQLSDAVEIAARDAGATVTLYFERTNG